MKKCLKRILLGLIIWVIPFLASFFVWDMKANAPSVSAAWFYALMSVTGAIGLAIGAYYYFKNIRKDTVKEGWITGITWYVELALLDLIFLVLLFGMTFADYSHLLLTYASPLVITIAIGYIKK